jgi:mannosyltransferase
MVETAQSDTTYRVSVREDSGFWKSSTISLGLILGLALWVRLHDLSRLSLWLDEGITTCKMRFSLRELFQYTVVDNVPPLYYLILHALGSWVDSDFSLRLPSALMGLATIPVLYWIGVLLFNRRVALLASLFLSLSTFHVWFSQEARSYAIYCFLYALSLLFLVRWSLNPAGRLNWWLYVAASGLMLYSHSTALIYLGTNAVIFFCLSGWREWKQVRQWLLAQALVIILFLPWLSSFHDQSQNYRQSVILGPLHLSAIVETLMVLTSMAPLWGAEAAKLVGSFRGLPEILMLTWFVGFSGPLASLLISWKRQFARGYMVAALMVTLPLAVVTVFSLLFVNIYFDRLFLPSTLGVSLLLAAGMEDVFDLFAAPSAKAVTALVFGSLIVLQLALSVCIYYRLERKEDFRSAAKLVAERYQDNDLAVFVTYSGEALFKWYQPAAAAHLRYTGIPKSFLNPPNQSPGHVIRSSADLSVLPPLAATADRVWLVRLRTQYHDPDELTLKWLSQHCYKERHHQLQGVSVDLFRGCEKGAQ